MEVETSTPQDILKAVHSFVFQNGGEIGTVTIPTKEFVDTVRYSRDMGMTLGLVIGTAVPVVFYFGGRHIGAKILDSKNPRVQKVANWLRKHFE